MVAEDNHVVGAVGTPVVGEVGTLVEEAVGTPVVGVAQAVVGTFCLTLC